MSRRRLTRRLTHAGKSAESRKTDAPASVFFRPSHHFTMRKIFLRRKKSCCTAQQVLLQHGKFHFSLRNALRNPLKSIK